jgi:hypothetical protein
MLPRASARSELESGISGAYNSNCAFGRPPLNKESLEAFTIGSDLI